MLRKSLAVLTLGLVALASAGADAAFSTAITATQTGANGGPQQSLGFDFTVNQSLTLSSLGVYQVAGGNSIIGQTVEIMDLTTSTVVATQVITGPVVAGTFNYVATTGVLSGTDTYSIFSLFTAGTPQYATGPIAPSADITLVPIQGDNTGYNPSPVLAPPNSGFSNIIAVNFQYTPTSALPVPEPASFAMLGLGLVGVAMIRRKMAKVAV